MSFRVVYVDAPGRQAAIAAVCPGASFITTPAYAGYNETSFLEVIGTDQDQTALENDQPTAPVDIGFVPDGVGSLITRRVKSTLLDGCAAAIATADSATTAIEKAAALTACRNLIASLLADAEDRPVDYRAQTE